MFLSTLVLILVAISFLGAFLRTTPLTLLGAIVTALATWFVVLTLVAAAAYLWAAGLRKRAWTTVVALIALFALSEAAVIEINLSRTARKNGVAVSALESFKLPDFATTNGVTTVPYRTFDGVPLNLTIRRPKVVTGGQPSPILIYVHGGGWVSGRAEGRHADLDWFAGKGWLVFAVDYSLSTKERHLWDVTQAQVGCAMAWVGAHAAEFGGNLSHLYMLGESAGGNLVINVSYMANADRLMSSCGGSVPHVSAVVSLYPVIDPADFYRNPDPIMGPSARSMASQYTGGSPEQYPERYRTISSASYLTPGAPPTMLIVGENDTLVPPEPTYAFAQQAKSEGVTVELVRVPYMSHAFDAIPHTLGNQLSRNGSAGFMQRH